MIILGLADNHDAGAALVIDGKLVGAINQERIDRKKGSGGFPWGAVDVLLKEHNIAYRHVDRVVDGDTIDVTIDLGFNVWIKERLRLYGLNTPETRTKDAEEKERGLKAKRYVENQVNSNQGKIQIQSLGRGKYGRVLAEIWVGKNNINELLISNGHAEIYMTD